MSEQTRVECYCCCSSGWRSCGVCGARSGVASLCDWHHQQLLSTHTVDVVVSNTMRLLRRGIRQTQVLLPPPPVHRWQLPHVPGGGEHKVIATAATTSSAAGGGHVGMLRGCDGRAQHQQRHSQQTVNVPTNSAVVPLLSVRAPHQQLHMSS